jgi:hypothetical protein
VGFLIRTPRRLAVFVFIAGWLSPVSKADEKVRWEDVDQLCGQLQLEVPEKKIIIVDGKSESRLYTAYLQGATVTLFPATHAEKECCAASPIAVEQARRL